MRVPDGKFTAAPRRSTHDRIADFPDEYLSVSARKLYYTACQIELDDQYQAQHCESACE